MLDRFNVSPIHWQTLEDELRPITKYLTGRVLNAGCGNRDVTAFLISSGAKSVDNCDIESTIPNAVICDLMSIPVDDNSYDSILNNAVLEHVEHADEVLGELHRLLKPGGHLVLCVPFLQPFHAVPTDFRRFTRDGLREIGERHGFQAIEIFPVHSMAQTVGWVLWECLKEKRAIISQALIWLPLNLWSRLSRRTDVELANNASAYQIILRKK